ncbi:hypothetical protein PMm318_A48500 [Pseudomonas moorei]
MQLIHDAAEKSKERITSIRREIYLRATDEAHRVMRHFIALRQVDLAETNTSEALHGFQSTLSKMQLVVEPGTLTLLNSLNKECTGLFVKLLRKVQPMQDLRTEMFGLDRLIEFMDEQATKKLAEIKILSAAPVLDGRQIDTLMKIYENQLAKKAEHQQAREAKREEAEHLSNAYDKAIFSELTPFGILLEKVSIEMRSELGLTTDAAAYAAEMGRLRIEMGELTERTLESMHSPAQ